MTQLKLTLRYSREDGATATIETFANEMFAGREAADRRLWEPVEYMEPPLLEKGYTRIGWEYGPTSEKPGITHARSSETLPEGQTFDQ